MEEEEVDLPLLAAVQEVVSVGKEVGEAVEVVISVGEAVEEVNSVEGEAKEVVLAEARSDLALERKRKKGVQMSSRNLSV